MYELRIILITSVDKMTKRYLITKTVRWGLKAAFVIGSWHLNQSRETSSGEQTRKY